MFLVQPLALTRVAVADDADSCAKELATTPGGLLADLAYSCGGSPSDYGRMHRPGWDDRTFPIADVHDVKPAINVHDAKSAAPAPIALPEKNAAAPFGLIEGLEFSADIAVVSDYRRGGISRSRGHGEIQAGFDVEAPSGWSAGVFASTITERKGAHAEVDLYGAKSFEFGETELTLGATAVVFPGGADIGFGLAQASVSRAIGPIDATLAVNYAWRQANLDNEDNLYVSLRARTPIGRLGGVPLTMGASVGRAQGHFAIEETKLDWSLSLTAHAAGIDFGVSYVDTDIDDRRGDPTCVFSIVHGF